MSVNDERLMRVLLGPHISEKSTRIADKPKKQITFKVVVDATKNEIKHAVEKLFNVKVAAVNVNNMTGKTRNFRQRPGRRNDWKKAYVTLQEGHDINFTGAE